MKKLFIVLLALFVFYQCTTSLLVCTNSYPFGYPIKQGEYYRITHIRDEGTPIEKTYVKLVRIDSTFEGYVIKATYPNGQIHTDGISMYYFMGLSTPIGPDKCELITKETFEAKK